MDEKEMLGKVKYLIKKKRPLEDIILETGLKEYEVFGFVELIRQQGYQIEYCDGYFSFKRDLIPKEPGVYEMPKGEDKRLMFVSDTHLGSKYDRLDILNYLYDKAQEEEIDTVFHIGDLTEGNYKNRPNHEYELRAHGVEEQLEYTVNKYPYREGVKTLFIGGNHDYTAIRLAGFDIGKAIAKERSDMIYLGQDVADVKYGKTRVRLYHGSKALPYARSYRMQKYVEQIPTEEKPQILLMGHFHNSFYMKYSDVHCFQVPAIIDQTPYARSLGLHNEKGAWFVDMTTDKNGNILSITPELLDFSNQTKVLRRKK